MAYIQRIKNKKGDAYRVYIQLEGNKRLTKTFSTKRAANKYVFEIEPQKFDYKRIVSNEEISMSYLITEYLSNIYKGTRPKTESRRLEYWVDKIGHKKVSEVSKFDVMEAFNQLPQN